MAFEEADEHEPEPELENIPINPKTETVKGVQIMCTMYPNKPNLETFYAG